MLVLSYIGVCFFFSFLVPWPKTIKMEFKAEELAFLSWIIEGLPNDRFLQIQEDKVFLLAHNWSMRFFLLNVRLSI